MDTKSQKTLPENIDRLLQSCVLEDVILGIEWVNNNMGREWMGANFIGNKLDPNSDYNYSTKNLKQNAVILWDDYNVLIGNIFIQFNGYHTGTHLIINNKTK